MNYRTIVFALFQTVTALWICGCTDDPRDINSDGGPVDTSADTDSAADTDTETDSDTDSNTDSDTFPTFSLEWTFDDGWDGFVHAFGEVEFAHDPTLGALVLDTTFTGPNQESSFGQEFFAADWRGATAIDIVVRTLEHTTGYWRIDLETTYAWSPCITTIPHPATTDWTTITFDIMEICGPSVALDLTQLLTVGVMTGPDAAASETVSVAVDKITVR